MSNVRWLALIGGALCAYVALSEFQYAHAHPYAYGPAIKIALLACGGVFLAAAAFAADRRKDA